MSLTVNNIGAATGNTISLGSGNLLLANNKIIQHAYVRTDTRTTYSASNSGDGTTVSALNLSFTPKHSNSMIWVRFNMHYEMHQDTVFLMHQDGVLIGYNQYRGNVRWSGIVAQRYDTDESTTPGNATVNWFVPAGGTHTRTYAPAVRSSSSGNYTLYLNRTVSSTGTDGQENGVSFGYAMEIARV